MRTINHTKPILTLTAILTIGLLTITAGATAATPPVKEVVTSHIGREVDESKGGNVCTVLSKDVCQAARLGSEPGTFESAKGVAGASGGEVYVTDDGNHRVQELTAAGTFVAMFGWDVNKTKEQEAAAQSERNVCTAISKDVCQAGVEGTAAGQFQSPGSVAVDPTNGDVYVAEVIFDTTGGEQTTGNRVQKFTAGGQFVWEIGAGVNETTKGDLCTAEEVEKGTKCGGPTLLPTDAARSNTEPFLSRGELVLAVGGPDDLLYVGDEHRIQEFEQSGKYEGELSLTSISASQGSVVSSIAVDESGDIYFVYEVNFVANVIHELDPTGKAIAELPVVGRQAGEGVSVTSLALDPTGRLAVGESESEAKPRGSLYDVSLGQLHLITEFVDISSSGISANSMAFNGNDQLYLIFEGELIASSPVPVGELLSGTAKCTPGPERETDVTLACALSGQVDAWGVRETEVSFQWGQTPTLGESTAPPSMVANVKVEGEEEPLVDVGATIGVRPNERYYDRVAGEDANVKAPELLTSETVSFTTPLVPAKIVGAPSASFISSSSVVLSSELNPENANTEYFFEYAPENGSDESPLSRCVAPLSVRSGTCPGVGSTPVERSAAYGQVGTTLEARGLQPATVYRYRLSTISENAGQTETAESTGPEERFTTAPAPVPQAASGTASSVSATSATVSGTVDPDGQPATYVFELGVYSGAGTQYGIVFSGAAGASTVPAEETLGLTGLQPGTTYAYRIAVKSGYGTATGAPVLFTTTGIPAVLSIPGTLPQLAIPAITFPAPRAAPAKVKATVKKKKPKKKPKKTKKTKAKAKKGSK